MYLIKLLLTLTLIVHLCENKKHLNRNIHYVALSKQLDPNVAKILGEELNKVIEESGKKFRSKQMAAEVLLNTNEKRLLQLKKKLQKQRKYRKSGVLISKDGILCDKRFCKNFGAGRHAIGICSPEQCFCKDKEPHPEKCGANRIFDPMENRCLRNSTICGSNLDPVKFVGSKGSKKKSKGSKKKVQKTEDAL